MKKFLTLFFLCYTVSSVNHSLQYLLTVTSRETNFTEFMGVAMMDNVEIVHCDSIKKEAKFKQDWMDKLVNKMPGHLEFYSQSCYFYQHHIEAFMEVLKKNLNQTEGPHVLQRMSGCDWDDESGEVKGFVQYGYDGEYLISLDLQAETWITLKGQADVIEYFEDRDKGSIERLKEFYLSTCPSWLQSYVDFRRSSLLGTERRPSVSLLQKTPSSLVSCHATGFYPDRADLFWRKDGEEIHEGVEKGEILPNNDGTFQMSSELDVSLVKQEDWRKYDCVFQLSGVKEDIITTLNKAKIQTNWVSPSEFPVHHYAIGVVAAVVLLLALGGVLYWWRKRW